ncbi:hypothetical protein [Aliivibrio logei]|uniref:hypothetical protein n=1 Tax=Aliivibrio logei TaxID=688 RepID=UPI0035C92BD1
MKEDSFATNSPPPQKENKLTRHEFLLSKEHQVKLDALVASHPCVNTRVAMIRLLIDDIPFQSLKTIKQDPDFIRQLSALGNLINQFLKLAHTCTLYGQPLSAELIIYKVDVFNRKLSKIIKDNISDNAA